ncbi:MAG TPA: Fic family protein [Balneolales bacterium]|nr:Fic family protein [Balneolales bacterium]
MKYETPNSEGEILPNKLGLKDKKSIEKEEYRGFLRAELKFESELDSIRSFDWQLISSIHKTALGHLYEFAGKIRQVNMSKGGFLFPAAKFLPDAIKTFEKDFLKTSPVEITDELHLIQVVAPLHAEFLFIHPFRDGNGRTARLVVNLIALKHGFESFNFDPIKKNRMDEYIFCVQSAADKNYQPMIGLFKTLREK